MFCELLLFFLSPSLCLGKCFHLFHGFFFSVGFIGRSPFFQLRAAIQPSNHPSSQPTSRASSELRRRLCDVSRQLDGVGALSPSTFIRDVVNVQQGAPFLPHFLTQVLRPMEVYWEVIPLTHTTSTQQRQQLQRTMNGTSNPAS